MSRAPAPHVVQCSRRSEMTLSSVRDGLSRFGRSRFVHCTPRCVMRCHRTPRPLLDSSKCEGDSTSIKPDQGRTRAVPHVSGNVARPPAKRKSHRALHPIYVCAIVFRQDAAQNICGVSRLSCRLCGGEALVVFVTSFATTASSNAARSPWSRR